MADKPAPTTGQQPKLNETAIAIIVSVAIGLVLATILAGNPFRATRLAFTDWSKTSSAITR